MAHKALTALRHGWPGRASSRCGVRLLDAQARATGALPAGLWGPTSSDRLAGDQVSSRPERGDHEVSASWGKSETWWGNSTSAAARWCGAGST